MDEKIAGNVQIVETHSGCGKHCEARREQENRSYAKTKQIFGKSGEKYPNKGGGSFPLRIDRK